MQRADAERTQEMIKTLSDKIDFNVEVRERLAALD